MVSSGDYVLLFPEDAPGLEQPVYERVTSLTAATVKITGAPNHDEQLTWSMALPAGSRSLAAGWVQDQVVDVTPTGVQVRHGDEISDCTTKHLIKTDPIISLLLWDAVTPHGHGASKIRQTHVQLLDEFLGHIANLQLKPSRDMAVILAGIVPDEKILSPDTVRPWVDMSTGMERHFPLQHAVDFVYVSDSHARRISKSIRDSIGASFCSPPTRGPHGQASTPTRAEAASQDSFYDAEGASIASNTAEDRHGSTEPSPSIPGRHRYASGTIAKAPTIDLPQAYDDLDKASKYAFRPTPHQAAVHELLVSPRKRFGMRGLSIMHFGFMDRVSKMVRVKSREANNQNFSRAVAMPEAQAPSSVDDITTALSSLQTYCTTFMATEVGDLVRSLHAFVQQEIPKIWPVEDLQHFVFWIDGVLKAFREAAVDDLHGGGKTRRSIQATVARNNPDIQATSPLLTQRRLQDLLRHGPLQLQSRQASSTRVVETAETGRRRQDQSHNLATAVSVSQATRLDATDQHQYQAIFRVVQAKLKERLYAAHRIVAEAYPSSGLSLPDLVRLARGETAEDSRPNKALDPSTYERLLVGFPQQELLVRIDREGFRARWLQASPPQSRWPRNHWSAMTSDHLVVGRIREGEEIVKCEHVSALAARIELLQMRFPNLRILMLKGDVHGHSATCGITPRMFAGWVAHFRTGPQV
ncbi:hypothetical protein GQ600_1948 [Phytophthora cactorum]|nr:hypothetical protein GQ600_1948 [Phytophthora cactorum]